MPDLQDSLLGSVNVTWLVQRTNYTLGAVTLTREEIYLFEATRKSQALEKPGLKNLVEAMRLSQLLLLHGPRSEPQELVGETNITKAMR